MQILRPENVAAPLVRRTFRSRPWPVTGLFLVFLAAPVLPALLVLHLLGPVGWVTRVVVAAIAILPMGLWILVMESLGRVVLASFSSESWVMKTTTDGVYLKFRSYMNRHFPDDGPTVAWVAFSEIASAGLGKETVETDQGTGDPIRRTTRKLEIRLVHEDTGELSSAVALETARPGPAERFAGIRGRWRAGHSPVLVPRPGTILVEWTGRTMLRTLTAHVRQHETERLEIKDEVEAGAPLDERIVQLVERGERIAAIGLARQELGLDLGAARRYVAAVLEKRAG